MVRLSGVPRRGDENGCPIRAVEEQTTLKDSKTGNLAHGTHRRHGIGRLRGRTGLPQKGAKKHKNLEASSVVLLNYGETGVLRGSAGFTGGS